MDLAEPEADADVRRGLDRAVRLLAQREHSSAELARKLRGKGLNEGLVAQIIDELQDRDLQSDERFVESFLRGRIRKGYGPLRIRQELSQRGIGEALAEASLTRAAEFWIDVAEQCRSKRFGDPPSGGDADSWNAQARFLSRRGFPSDIIYRVLGSRS